MKKIIVSIATLMAIQTNAQVATNGIFNNQWMGLTPTLGPGAIRSVGFGGGFAGFGGLPQSRFQINDFIWASPANGSIAPGALFRTDGNDANLNQWQFFTGNNGNVSNEKFKLYIPANSSNAGIQSTRGVLFFNTASANVASGGVAERMRLSQGLGGNLAGGWNTTAGVTKVQISHDGFGASYLPPAVAMLNIGTSVPGPSGGNRNWMDVGTYYAMNTENMYIGLKDAGGMNNSNAIINWGDDAVQPNTNNRLLFNFTGFPGQGQSSTNDGLEVGRMWASANAGRMGIGGCPLINPYFSNQNDPTNTLEINSTGVFNAGVVGTSGLRFTDLRTGSTPITNPGTGVLSVDANGDVILVPGGGIANANNGISVNAAGVVQLGVPCTLPGGGPNFPGLSATQLTQDRAIYIANQNFWFGNANTETGAVAIGGNPTGTPWCNIGNTFEVSANAKNTKYGNIAASGVRLTKLLSTSPTVPNGTYGVNSSKVLTVDQDGDVVLTDASAGLGNICSAATQNPLASNWEIPLANHSFIFSGQAANDNVGVGTTCAPTAKFQVQDNTGAIATSAIGYKVAGGFLSTHSNGLSASMAAINTSNVFNATAGYFRGNPVNKVHAIIVPQNGGYVGFGITSPAVQLHVVSGGGVQIDNGNLNVNGALTNLSNPGGAALSIAGNVTLFGDITGSGVNTYVSDSQFKTNVDTIANVSAIIKQLKPKTYFFDTTDVHGFDFDNKKQYGFIAQDIELVLPELVRNNVKPAVTDSTGTIIHPSVSYKSLNYNALFAILVKGIQQQQLAIDSLTTKLNSKDSIQDARLTALENAINQCCSSAASRNNNSNLNQLDIELSDKDAIVLNQNVPNPFAEQTTITYNVPASVGKAQIIFFNTNGQIIQTVDIKTRGKGKVNVFASDLSSGLYNYTLVADGKVIDSKKMVRE